MDLDNIDILLLVTLERFDLSSVQELSRILALDYPPIYKSIKKLNDTNLIIDNGDRPKKFTINQKIFDKWTK